jgi:hypothetical protein
MPPLENVLKRVFNARVAEVLPESTPLDLAERLSSRIGHRVLLKREDLTPVFSFKLRGAYNRIVALSDAERSKGVIAAFGRVLCGMEVPPAERAELEATLDELGFHYLPVGASPATVFLLGRSQLQANH